MAVCATSAMVLAPISGAIREHAKGARLSRSESLHVSPVGVDRPQPVPLIATTDAADSPTPPHVCHVPSHTSVAREGSGREVRNPSRDVCDGVRSGVRARVVDGEERAMTTLYKNKVAPCLWFDTQAEDAAKHYTTIFENSRIVHVSHYGSAGPRPAGMVMVVHFDNRRSGLHRPERWPRVHLRRGDLVPGELRLTGRDRHVLDQVVRGRRGRTVWMGEGQVRRVVADRSHAARRAHP